MINSFTLPSGMTIHGEIARTHHNLHMHNQRFNPIYDNVGLQRMMEERWLKSHLQTIACLSLNHQNSSFQNTSHLSSMITSNRGRSGDEQLGWGTLARPPTQKGGKSKEVNQMFFYKATIPYQNTYPKMPNPLWNKSSNFIGNTRMWIGNTNENAGFRIDIYKSPKYEMRLDLKDAPIPGWKC